MKEQTLFRLALILQDQAPSTLNKYICKLSEIVLSEYPNGLSLDDLTKMIEGQFNLTFSPDEIRTAIEKKGDNSIFASNNVYFLQKATQQKLLEEVPITESLKTFILQFVEKFPSEIPADKISELLLKYLYYCFNSNVDNLLSLFGSKEIDAGNHDLDLSNEEITIINQFITWNNPQKDALIYSVVSTCYEYCMLTIKKDSILSKELFSGKRFYLDANIIFRMAGINNKERETVTKGFVAHCKQAGIKLLCTSNTLDEVYRVITAQIGFIQSIAGNGCPVSCDILERINPSLEINDFDKLYYEWCQQPQNHFGDYVAFNRYLLGLVQNTISQLDIQQSALYKSGKLAAQYESQVNDLRDYKNKKRKWRNTSRSSAETDVANILDIVKSRNKSNNTMWQTNDYLVSADQLLIGWANNIFSGVPIVVLPSVWLSIILRFTGRTDDDYKSFCLFLTQRQHAESENIIDPAILLKCVNTKTNSTKLKEQIVVEITQNKAQYSFTSNEDYDFSIDRAFDKVLKTYYGKTEKQIEEMKKEMEDQLDSLTKSSKEYADEQTIIGVAAGKEKAAIIFAKKKAAQKVKIFRALSKPAWIYYLIAGAILIFSFMVWVYEIQPIYGGILMLIPDKLKNNDTFDLTWTVLGAAGGLLVGGVKVLFSNLGSQERETRLYHKYYMENMESVAEE